MGAPVIDVHTHLLPPRYLELLRSRSEPPMIAGREAGEFLVHLPLPFTGPPANAPGMPLTDNFWSPEAKLAFMAQAGIDISLLSLGNPWLDFVAEEEAVDCASALNDDFEQIAAESPGRFFTLGVLPAAAGPVACAAEVDRIAAHPHARGVILSTWGCGNGVDDVGMDVVWERLVAYDFVAFVHPHYGIGNENYAGYGVSLLIGLGFTFETTIAAARLVLGGALDRFPSPKLMLAHAGGTAPFLAARLDASLTMNPALSDLKAPSEALRGVILDAVVYSDDALRLVLEFGDPSRIVFGTDHPFLVAGADHLLATIDSAAGPGSELATAVRGGNAKALFRL